MTQQAAWWGDPSQSDKDGPVVRHAPDPTQYHYPDSDQLGKMRGSKVGRFAVVPAANNDGTSKGFDPTVAGPVHIDPDAPDGGVIFDPSTVRKSQINSVVEQVVYPHQAYYLLGQPANRQKAAAAPAEFLNTPAPVAASHRPGSYIVPHANGVGRQFPTQFAQEEHHVQPVPIPPLASLQMPAQVNRPTDAQPYQAPMHPQGGEGMPPQQPQYQPPPAQYHQMPPQYAQPPAYVNHGQYPALPPMDPNMQGMMHQMAGLQQAVAALLNNAQRPAAPAPQPLPVGLPPVATVPGQRPAQPRRTVPVETNEYDEDAARPIRKQVRRNKETQEIEEVEDDPRSLIRRSQEDDDRPQTTRDVAAARRGEPEAIIAGFETLDLKFVVGPLPLKAKRQVVFEIPGAGRQMARFHDVVVSKACIVLVYDTRYEDGNQYEPPETLDAPMTLHVTSLKKAFRVSSMGLNYSLGVFDHIVLVRHPDDQVELEGQEEE